MQHPSVQGLAEGPWCRLQHKQGIGLRRLAVFGHAVKRAVHGAAGRAQAAAAGVLERLARLEQGLLAHHAQAFDLFGVAAGVTDDPVREISWAGASPVLVMVMV
jgi:hypothetical protein